jgi:hypothetical protein
VTFERLNVNGSARYKGVHPGGVSKPRSDVEDPEEARVLEYIDDLLHEAIAAAASLPSAYNYGPEGPEDDPGETAGETKQAA